MKKLPIIAGLAWWAVGIARWHHRAQELHEYESRTQDQRRRVFMSELWQAHLDAKDAS